MTAVAAHIFTRQITITMVTILFVLCAFTLAAFADAEICMTSNSPYDPQTQLCCRFGVTANEGGQLGCCGNTTFLKHSQVCCGEQFVFDKIGTDRKETKCCGFIPYTHSDKICCGEKLYDRKNDVDGCCGKALIDSGTTECCRDKSRLVYKAHQRMENMKCCLTDYYNRSTHYCANGREVLPLFTKRCDSVLYNEKNQKCCDKNLHNITGDIQHTHCCGSKPYNDRDQKCCEDFLIPRNAKCCGNGNYFEETQRCCNGVPVNYNKNTEDCCGTGLYDTKYQRCCGQNIYNATTHQCCEPNGDVISKSSDYKCCGTHKYSSTNQVCCHEMDQLNRNSQYVVISKEPGNSFHDECCSTPNEKQSFCSRTHRCLQNGSIIPREDMCGDTTYNMSTDLCCNGVFHENGKVKGKDCCGVQSYDKVIQICCDNMVNLKTEKPSCVGDKNDDPPEHYGICSYCSYDRKKVRRVLKPEKNICNLKAIKIKVMNKTNYQDQVMLHGIVQKYLFNIKKDKRTQVDIRLPCSCKFHSKSAILVTDQNDFSKPVRLGDSDIFVPWTKKMNKALHEKWGKCLTDNNRKAFDTVSKIFHSVLDFTKNQLNINNVVADRND